MQLCIYKLINLNLYLARQTSLQLSKIVVGYATVYIGFNLETCNLAWQSS